MWPYLAAGHNARGVRGAGGLYRVAFAAARLVQVWAPEVRRAQTPQLPAVSATRRRLAAPPAGTECHRWKLSETLSKKEVQP
jgi:hypothetical protein